MIDLLMKKTKKQNRVKRSYLHKKALKSKVDLLSLSNSNISLDIVQKKSG